MSLETKRLKYLSFGFVVALRSSIDRSSSFFSSSCLVSSIYWKVRMSLANSLLNTFSSFRLCMALSASKSDFVADSLAASCYNYWSAYILFLFMSLTWTRFKFCYGTPPFSSLYFYSRILVKAIGLKNLSSASFCCFKVS